MPLIKLIVDIKIFNTDKLKDIDKRISKINKGVENFKNSVMNSFNKQGNYKEFNWEIYS